MLNNDTA